MKHTIKEALKLYDAHKKGRVIQRRKNTRWDWEDIKDFNEDYILEEEYDYRVFPSYFRLPTINEYKSIAREFSKLDVDNKCRIFLNEESGNKLHFYDVRLNQDKEDSIDRSFCWCSDFVDSTYANVFNGLNVEYLKVNKSVGVRLVSDEPFEGGIKFGDVWWKPENEEGFYTWEEAMEKFNK